MYATTGVLPLPPTRRLPTLTTGARAGGAATDRARTTAAAGWSPRRTTSAEEFRINGPDGRGWTRRRPEGTARPAAAELGGDDRERLVLRAAVGFDQRARRRAEPRAAHRIGHERQQRLFELALGLHLHGGAVGEERVGDLLEVLHVRAEDDRLAEDRRLEDVVAAVIDEAAADEHGGGELIELRQLADRVEDDDVGARLGVDRQLGSPRRDEPGVARQPLDFAEALGLARRQDERARSASSS